MADTALVEPAAGAPYLAGFAPRPIGSNLGLTKSPGALSYLCIHHQMNQPKTALLIRAQLACASVQVQQALKVNSVVQVQQALKVYIVVQVHHALQVYSAVQGCIAG